MSDSGKTGRGTGSVGGKRPNILWIMTDEQRADTLGCYGNRWAQSPNLDRLAARGATFGNCYCQSPVCVPSRATQLTGKYGHTCEVLENWYHLNITGWHRERIAEAMEKKGADAYQKRCEELSRVFPDRFKGKYTADVPEWWRQSIGRALAQRFVADEEGLIDQGPQHRMFPEILADAGYHTTHVGKLHHNAPHPGFQDVPDVPDLEHAYWFGLRNDYSLEANNAVVYPPFPILFGGTFPADASETTTSKWTDIALDCLKTKVREPFLLRLSLRSPHTPVLAPQPFDRLFDPKDMPIPHPTVEDLMGMSRHDQSTSLPVFRNYLDDEQTRRLWATYYGLAAHVDDQIGRLLDALADSPYADNTIVFFNSDHGAMLGEHDLLQKEIFFDEATHVPLIMSWPGRIPEGKRVDGLAQLIDVAPTLFELAGLETPGDMEGASLCGAMQGGGNGPHDAVFSELHIGIPDTQWLRGEAAGTVRRLIRTPEWRMTVNYPEDPVYGPDGSLYNLAEDPGESRNLYNDPKYRSVVEGLRKQMIDWVEGAR